MRWRRRGGFMRGWGFGRLSLKCGWNFRGDGFDRLPGPKAGAKRLGGRCWGCSGGWSGIIGGTPMPQLLHDPFDGFELGGGLDVDGLAGDGVVEDEGFLE